MTAPTDLAVAVDSRRPDRGAYVGRYRAGGLVFVEDVMGYDYVREAYGVNPKPGQRITMNGKPGTIVKTRGNPQYLRVRFDGEKHIVNVHPTWRVNYSRDLPENT